jgi:hypothetical protein
MKNSTQQGEKDSVRGATIFERVVCRGCRGSALSRSWAVDIPDGFAWVGSVSPIVMVGFFGCSREHAVESAGQTAAGAGGVVCDGTPMFRIRCSGRVVCGQSSE